MYKRLGEAVLRSGECMEIGVVRGPDTDWYPRIVPFLGHKQPDTRTQIRRSLAGEKDRLESRYYVGQVDGHLISQIMVVGSRGVGILGHVYTLPEERRKGACRAIMEIQMADTAAAGYDVLCLGTGYDTPPYWIYHSFGFRPITEGVGRMWWERTPGAREALLRPGAAHVRRIQWDDWAHFDLLAYQPAGEDEELPRASLLGLNARESVEGAFVSYMLRREEAPMRQGYVLESEHGATVGWALLAPDPSYFGDVWRLDLHTAPGFTAEMPRLLEPLVWPEAPVLASGAAPEGPRAAALRGVGFQSVGALTGAIRQAGVCRDLNLYYRHLCESHPD